MAGISSYDSFEWGDSIVRPEGPVTEILLLLLRGTKDGKFKWDQIGVTERGGGGHDTVPIPGTHRYRTSYGVRGSSYGSGLRIDVMEHDWSKIGTVRIVLWHYPEQPTTHTVSIDDPTFRELMGLLRSRHEPQRHPSFLETAIEYLQHAVEHET